MHSKNRILNFNHRILHSNNRILNFNHRILNSNHKILNSNNRIPNSNTQQQNSDSSSSNSVFPVCQISITFRNPIRIPVHTFRRIYFLRFVNDVGGCWFPRVAVALRLWKALISSSSVFFRSSSFFLSSVCCFFNVSKRCCNWRQNLPFLRI